jgi:hypothetical protein
MVKLVGIKRDRDWWEVTFSSPVIPSRRDGTPDFRWYLREEKFPDRMSAFMWAQRVIEEQEDERD